MQVEKMLKFGMNFYMYKWLFGVKPYIIAKFYLDQRTKGQKLMDNSW